MDVPLEKIAFLAPDCQSNCHIFSSKKIELSLFEKIDAPILAGF
jgi:hypothetical protein